MTKDDLRKELKLLRRSISNDTKERASHIISGKVFGLLEMKKPKTVMLYLSAFNEVNTDEILTYLLDNEIKVVSPISNMENNTIIPTYITKDTDLIKGGYGIREPKESNVASIEDIDICIIPAIGFDTHKNRLGFGKGYYDKFLLSFNGLKIGVGYDFQVVDSIPATENDVKMDIVITEERTIE